MKSLSPLQPLRIYTSNELEIINCHAGIKVNAATPAANAVIDISSASAQGFGGTAAYEPELSGVTDMFYSATSTPTATQRSISIEGLCYASSMSSLNEITRRLGLLRDARRGMITLAMGDSGGADLDRIEYNGITIELGETVGLFARKVLITITGLSGPILSTRSAMPSGWDGGYSFEEYGDPNPVTIPASSSDMVANLSAGYDGGPQGRAVFGANIWHQIAPTAGTQTHLAVPKLRIEDESRNNGFEVSMLANRFYGYEYPRQQAVELVDGFVGNQLSNDLMKAHTVYSASRVKTPTTRMFLAPTLRALLSNLPNTAMQTVESYRVNVSNTPASVQGAFGLFGTGKLLDRAGNSVLGPWGGPVQYATTHASNISGLDVSGLRTAYATNNINAGQYRSITPNGGATPVAGAYVRRIHINGTGAPANRPQVLGRSAPRVFTMMFKLNNATLPALGRMSWIMCLSEWQNSSNLCGIGVALVRTSVGYRFVLHKSAAIGGGSGYSYDLSSSFSWGDGSGFVTPHTGRVYTLCVLVDSYGQPRASLHDSFGGVNPMAFANTASMGVYDSIINPNLPNRNSQFSIGYNTSLATRTVYDEMLNGVVANSTNTHLQPMDLYGIWEHQLNASEHQTILSGGYPLPIEILDNKNLVALNPQFKTGALVSRDAYDSKVRVYPFETTSLVDPVRLFSAEPPSLNTFGDNIVHEVTRATPLGRVTNINGMGSALAPSEAYNLIRGRL